MCIYVYICVYMCIYIYIYIYNTGEPVAIVKVSITPR